MGNRQWNGLWLYFLLAYAFSWALFVPLALQGQGLWHGIPAWTHLLGAYGPLLASVIVTFGVGGQAGVSELWDRVTRWRIGWPWWGLALFSPFIPLLLVGLPMALFNGDWSGLTHFGQVAELHGVGGMIGWLVWLITFGLGEEVGWRGFALPRLQHRFSARTASLILGLVWAAWHIPTFFYNYDPSLIAVIAFTVSIVAGAMLLTWLYNSTGGSVLATILWHGTYNATVAGAEGVVAAGATAIVILVVILIIRRYGPETLSHQTKHILN